MAEIVNLRRARKARERAVSEARASENRAAFGRSKAEQQTTMAQAELDQRQHEGHRLVAVTDPKPVCE